MQEIQELFQQLTQQINFFQQSHDEHTNYSRENGIINYQRNTSNPIENEVINAETEYDKMNEKVNLQSEVVLNGETILSFIEELKEKTTEFVTKERNELNEMKQKRSTLSETIIEMKEQMIRTNQGDVEELRNEISKFKEEIMLERYMLEGVEIRKLEEWTRRRCGNVIFDSNFDDWNVNTCQFTQRVLNKSHIVIVIDDGKKNIFGGYIDTVIKNMWCSHDLRRNANNESRTVDPNAFVFSMKRDGEEKLRKYQTADSSQSFVLYDEKGFRLFHFGCVSHGRSTWNQVFDIDIMRKPHQHRCRCNKATYDYQGEENSLRPSGEFFIPKRFVVVQMN